MKSFSGFLILVFAIAVTSLFKIRITKLPRQESRPLGLHETTSTSLTEELFNTNPATRFRFRHGHQSLQSAQTHSSNPTPPTPCHASKQRQWQWPEWEWRRSPADMDPPFEYLVRTELGISWTRARERCRAIALAEASASHSSPAASARGGQADALSMQLIELRTEQQARWAKELLAVLVGHRVGGCLALNAHLHLYSRDPTLLPLVSTEVYSTSWRFLLMNMRLCTTDMIYVWIKAMLYCKYSSVNKLWKLWIFITY